MHGLVKLMLASPRRFGADARAGIMVRPALAGQASIEDVDYRVPRKLDKALFQHLATCRWVVEYRNVLVTGPPEPAS